LTIIVGEESLIGVSSGTVFGSVNNQELAVRKDNELTHGATVKHVIVLLILGR
jgi:hypothetical protein